jgi:hypothetical protein
VPFPAVGKNCTAHRRVCCTWGLGGQLDRWLFHTSPDAFGLEKNMCEWEKECQGIAGQLLA